MARTGVVVVFLSVVVFSSVFVGAYDHGEGGEGLIDDYYRFTCPDAEKVIKRVAHEIIFNASNSQSLGFATAFLRMSFHDCFVEGCDGSLFLEGSDTEKTADVNKRLFGFDEFDQIKAAVEDICPGVVSCADILQYAVRDSVVALNGTSWDVQGGRKDGVVSLAEAPERELPKQDLFARDLIASFARRGLSAFQMVVLSGSHTVGVGHCDVLQKRLYDFSKSDPTDPSLDADYAKDLKSTCPFGNATSNDVTFTAMDFVTPADMDSNYYKNLEQHKGLFTSDQTLFDDDSTRAFVQKLTDKNLFLHEFGQAMRAMAAVGVKLKGQVRKDCRKVNDDH